MRRVTIGFVLMAAIIIGACQKEPLPDQTKTVEPETAEEEITRDAPSAELNGSVPKSPVAHLCFSGEQIYLTAKMQNIVQTPKAKARYKLVPTTKIVSLCLSTDNSALIYRYGDADNIELEQASTPDKPFKNFHRYIGNLYEEYFSFSLGNYHYVILEAGGMASGISLRVYEGDKKIVNKFSGNEMSQDYYQTHMNIPENLLLKTQPPMIHVE